MPSTLIEIANAIKNLNDSKWHCHIQYFVSKIGISPEVADSFIRQIEKGGRGVRSNGTWHANPSPYENPIDLTSPNDNILGLRYSIVGDGARSVHETTFAEPSPIVASYPGTYFQIGKLSKQKKLITVSIQREIVQYIIGTHRELLKHYPKRQSLVKRHGVAGSTMASRQTIINKSTYPTLPCTSMMFGTQSLRKEFP